MRLSLLLSVLICLLMHAGMTFSGMAVVSLMVVMPASMAADALGRKWTIIPSCLTIAAALSLMAVSGQDYFKVTSVIPSRLAIAAAFSLMAVSSQNYNVSDHNITFIEHIITCIEHVQRT